MYLMLSLMITEAIVSPFGYFEVIKSEVKKSPLPLTSETSGEHFGVKYKFLITFPPLSSLHPPTQSLVQIIVIEFYFSVYLYT